MKSTLGSFWRCEDGQDLTEYTLLLAFICMAAVAIVVDMGNSIEGVWTAVHSRVAVARNAI